MGLDRHDVARPVAAPQGRWVSVARVSAPPGRRRRVEGRKMVCAGLAGGWGCKWGWGRGLRGFWGWNWGEKSAQKGAKARTNRPGIDTFRPAFDHVRRPFDHKATKDWPAVAAALRVGEVVKERGGGAR